MTHPLGRMLLVVNPTAGKRTVDDELPRLRATLDDLGVDHEVHHTTGPGDATTAARQAVDGGVRYVVAVGGDGTVHEVVNGMFDDERPVDPEAVLGIVSAGSGCDFARTFGLDRTPETIARHLSTAEHLRVDLGVAEVHDDDGRPHTELFTNVAEAGWGAEAVFAASRMSRRLGAARYLLGAYKAYAAQPRVEVDVDLGHLRRRVRAVNVVAANGQYFGGGMWVAPTARSDDGRLDVQLYTGPRHQVFTLSRKIYKGRHLPHPGILEHRTDRVRIEPEQPMRVEADGEILGWTPATFRLLPGALRLKV